MLLIIGGTTSPLNLSTTGNYDLPPIGLLSIGAALLQHGYEVHLVDLLTRSYTRDQFTEELEKLPRPPIAVGVTVFTETATACMEVAREVKRHFPDTVVVYGGPHATFCADELLRSSDVDIVARGEGDSAMVEILESIKHPRFTLAHIDGIGYRDIVARQHSTA